MQQNISHAEQSDEDFYDYAMDLEKQWKQSLLKYTDKELLKVFPAAKEMIPEKIADFTEEKAKLLELIKKELIKIRQEVTDETSQMILREGLKVIQGRELLQIESHLSRLKSLLYISNGKCQKNTLSNEQIYQALQFPIENLIPQQTQLRNSGRNLVGLCPLHQEKTPSFFIYKESNSCWCFGCNQGGNSINLARLLHGYSFKESVNYLIGNY